MGKEGVRKRERDEGKRGKKRKCDFFFPLESSSVWSSCSPSEFSGEDI